MSRRKWLVLTALSMEAKAVEAAIGDRLGTEVFLHLIGIGARRLRPKLLADFEQVILAGFAGALDPSLKIGDFVVDGQRKIYCSDRLVATAEEKRSLFEKTQCVAVDMESGIVRAAAESAGVRLIHIRAISDTADQAIPRWIFNCIDETGRIRPARAATALAAHPMALPMLMRLSRQSRLASASMAQAVLLIVTGQLRV